MEKTKSKLGFIILSILMMIGIAASITLSAISIGKSNKILAQTKASNEAKKNDNDDDSEPIKEDDVVIADEYVIKSTKQISDAYISGDASELSDRDKETLKMASDILAEIITDGMTDFEKEKAVYDWMCNNLSYDSDALVVIHDTSNSDNPYGVLKYHDAVCVGYATTFRLFMQMMKIDCMVVHDTNFGHSWDLVKIEGHWYHTDIFMDVDDGNYANFNMNDDTASMGHDWDRTFFPEADSLECNYLFKSRVELKDANKLPAMIRELIDNEGGILSLSYSDQDIAVIYETINMIDGFLNAKLVDYSMDINYISTEDVNLLIINIEYYGDDDDDDDDDDYNLDDDEVELIKSNINNAFEDLGYDSEADYRYFDENY